MSGHVFGKEIRDCLLFEAAVVVDQMNVFTLVCSQCDVLLQLNQDEDFVIVAANETGRAALASFSRRLLFGILRRGWIYRHCRAIGRPFLLESETSG